MTTTSIPLPMAEVVDTPYSTLPATPRKLGFRQRKDWPVIHEDIMTSALSPKEICLKYDLRTESGTLAIVRVALYRKKTLEKFKDLFAKADEMTQAALRGEILGKMRHVYDSASEGHELAKSQKTMIGRGKNVTMVDAPNFGAMSDQQGSMLNAATKLAEMAGVGPSAPVQAPMYQDNRVVTILALPKADGVPSRAPAKVIEATHTPA